MPKAADCIGEVPDTHIIHCSTISSCYSAVTFETVKPLKRLNQYAMASIFICLPKSVYTVPCFLFAQSVWVLVELFPLPASSQCSPRLTPASPLWLHRPHHQRPDPAVNPAAAAHPLPTRQNRRRSRHGPSNHVSHFHFIHKSRHFWHNTAVRQWLQ